MMRIILRIVQTIADLAPHQLKWWLWWLITPKFNHGIFVAIFYSKDGEDFLVTVQKRFGIGGTEGHTLPGGGRKYGETLEAAALREAREETGLAYDSGELVLINTYSKSDSRDVQTLYWYDTKYFSCNFSANLEIESVHTRNVKLLESVIKNKDHLKMAMDAYAFFKSHRNLVSA